MENENQAIKIIKELYYEKMISQLIFDIISKSILLLIYFMIAYLLNFPIYDTFIGNGPFNKELLLSKELLFPLVITFIFSLYIEIYHEIKLLLFKILAFDKFVTNNYIQNETFKITMARYNNHLNELEKYKDYRLITENKHIFSLYHHIRYFLYLFAFCTLYYIFNSNIELEYGLVLSSLVTTLVALLAGFWVFYLFLLIFFLSILIIFLPLVVIMGLNLSSFLKHFRFQYTNIIDTIDAQENRDKT